MLGVSGGLVLCLATNKPVFIPICGLAGVGYGMIRNNNVKRNDEKKSGLDSFLSFVLKALTVYILGPSLLFLGLFTVLAIASK